MIRSVKNRIESLFDSIIRENQNPKPDQDYITACKLQIIKLRNEKELHEFFNRIS